MPALQAKNVFKVYDMGKTMISAVCNVNLEVYKGDFLSITGKSGSGKSTLMHMIGLLDTPTSGEIIINGKNTKGMTEVELAEVRNKEIGFVFQDFNLLSRSTVLDNVMLPLKYSKEKIAEKDREELAKKLLKQVGLEGRLTNKSNELSGGERQRVAIARALINNPSIILADEPTGNLDSKTGEEIEKMFIDLNKKGITVVIVTHDNDLAQIAKRKIILRDGKMLNENK
ncbi:MAG: ABC transporter ATP-binding protein [Patescibacteria group bacterium]